MPLEIMKCVGAQTRICQRCHSVLATTYKSIHRWFYTTYDNNDDEPDQDTEFAHAANQAETPQRPDASWYCRHCWLQWKHGSGGTVPSKHQCCISFVECMDDKSSSGSGVSHGRVSPFEYDKLQSWCDQVDVGHNLLTCRAVDPRAKMEEAKGRYVDEGGDVRFHEICLCPDCWRYFNEAFTLNQWQTCFVHRLP